MAKRISIRDIARAVGLHHTTVGLALRDSPRLKKATREKIRAVAAELGYRPDPMLSALISYRNSKRTAAFHAVIAWINNWPDRNALLVNSTYRNYFEGASARADDLGYMLQEFWLHENGMTPAKMRRIFQARNITGLLIAPQPVSQGSIGLDFQDFSAVAFGYSMHPHMLHLVTNHHTQTMDLVIAKLVELGYRRPGYCILPSTDAGGNYIWISRLMHIYSRYPELSQIPRMVSKEGAAFAKWIKKYQPDVLIGFNNFLPEVEKLGYQVPADIGFVSMAVDPKNPRISGANENDFLIGKTALDVLVGMIHRGERGAPEVPIRTLIDSTWFPGETLRPRLAAGTGSIKSQARQAR
ncbi:MAG: LacI family DNA-binding transcriptional regulator [Terrimicrobiaceae bacterium]